jgi:hypothetical protein
VVKRKFKIYDYTFIGIYWNIHLSLQAFSSPVSKFSFCTLMEINDRYHRVPLLWNLNNAPCFVCFEDHLLVSTCLPVSNSATTMWMLLIRITVTDLHRIMSRLSHFKSHIADLHKLPFTCFDTGRCSYSLVYDIVIQVLQSVSFIHFSF